MGLSTIDHKDRQYDQRYAMLMAMIHMPTDIHSATRVRIPQPARIAISSARMRSGQQGPQPGWPLQQYIGQQRTRIGQQDRAHIPGVARTMPWQSTARGRAGPVRPSTVSRGSSCKNRMVSTKNAKVRRIAHQSRAGWVVHIIAHSSASSGVVVLGQLGCGVQCPNHRLCRTRVRFRDGASTRRNSSRS